jgi:ribosomal protein S18 acetylase RimI-like enzyme
MDAAGAARIVYRRSGKADARGVAEVLYRTGFLGEDLTGRGLFGDRRLFALVNTEYYLRYESRNAFVAVDEAGEGGNIRGRIAGYIIGASDTAAFASGFRRRMRWRIALRAVLVSSWRYPESFRQVLAWARSNAGDSGRFNEDYPAHLHINVLPGYQRLGIGETLMRLFLEGLESQGLRGVHLGTSNRNAKALPFYRKQGFEVLAEQGEPFWTGVEGHVTVVFGKKLLQS